MSETLRLWLVVLVALVLPSAAARAEGEGFECLIEPSRVIELASPSAGVLDQVLVDRGDRVAKDDLVAHLQSDIERATLDVAQRRARLGAAIEAATARMEFEERELARRRELRRQDHVAERELEEAEVEARLAALRLEELKENQELARLELERTRVVLGMRGIRSTEDALVVERYKNPGEYVEEEPVVRLAVVRPLHVETVLPVAMLGRVGKGATARIVPEEPVGGEFVGTVAVVDEVVDAATSTFRVRLELANEQGEIPAGLRCQLRFDEPAEGVTRVPAEPADGLTHRPGETEDHGGSEHEG